MEERRLKLLKKRKRRRDWDQHGSDERREVDLVAKYADVMQVARATCRISCAERGGKMRKPVLLKRGLSSTVKNY